jgi:hypothetical protein
MARRIFQESLKVPARRADTRDMTTATDTSPAAEPTWVEAAEVALSALHALAEEAPMTV